VDSKNEEEKRMRTTRDQSIQNFLNEQEQGYRHSLAEFTATAAIARMDKRIMVVVGMMVKRAEEL
jgi:membrane carboxypeptidase/penicillin-binding protein PbpC